MERSRSWLGIAFLLLTIVSGHSAALAAGNITVSINGLTCSPALTPGLAQVLIATQCPPVSPQITITDYSAASKARVITEGTDGNSDILTLKNTLITANTTLTNFHIVFQKQFDPGPNSPPNQYYKPHLYGKMTASSPNKITATYTLKDSSGNTLLTSSLTHTWSNGVNINRTISPAPLVPVSYSGPRTLVVDLNIEHLNAGNTLDFRATSPFMKYHSQAFPQDPGLCLPESDPDYDPICSQIDPEPTATPLLNTLLNHIGPGREGCLGIYFPNSGCVGVYIK